MVFVFQLKYFSEIEIDFDSQKLLLVCEYMNSCKVVNKNRYQSPHNANRGARNRGHAIWILIELNRNGFPCMDFQVYLFIQLAELWSRGIIAQYLGSISSMKTNEAVAIISWTHESWKTLSTGPRMVSDCGPNEINECSMMGCKKVADWIFIFHRYKSLS